MVNKNKNDKNPILFTVIISDVTNNQRKLIQQTVTEHDE